jgi:hypothetical protein
MKQTLNVTVGLAYAFDHSIRMRDRGHAFSQTFMRQNRIVALQCRGLPPQIGGCRDAYTPCRRAASSARMMAVAPQI